MFKNFKSFFAYTLLLSLAQPSCYIAPEMGSARLAQRMVGQLGKFNAGMFGMAASPQAASV